MKRSSATRLCYALIVASIPASAVLAIWLSPGAHDYLSAHLRQIDHFLFQHVYPAFPTWPQQFAVQTLAALIAVWGALSFVGRPRWLRWPSVSRRHVFPALVAGYALWGAASYFWSAWPYGTRAYVIRELPFYFICAVAMLTCGRPERWITVARAFLLSAVAQAALQACIIFYMARVQGKALATAFLDNAVMYSNRNAACAPVITAGLIALGFALYEAHDALKGTAARRRGWGGRALVWTATAGALAVFAFIFLTAESLAGKVAAAVAVCGYAFALVPGKSKYLIPAVPAAVVAATVIVLIASQSFWTRAARAILSPERTTHLRVVDWLACKEMYVRKPIQGWGMGAFAVMHGTFHPPLARKLPFTRDLRTTHPHNEFIRAAAEEGLVGLLLYAGIWVYALGVSYVGLRDKPLKVRLAGYALWAGALAYAVHCAFGKEPVMWGFAANYWLLLGVLASASHWLGTAQPAEQQDERLRPGPAGWAAFVIVTGLVAWAWWTWAWGAYVSIVALNRSQTAQLQMHRPEQAQFMFEQFRENLERARPRCLWPDEILHADYVTGWFQARHGEWDRAAQQLEAVQKTAPEFLDTRLLLAECYLRLGRRQEALEQLNEFLRRDPYLFDTAPLSEDSPAALAEYLLRDARKPTVYDLLAEAGSLELATSALEQHVVSRLVQPEDWIVEDLPSPKELRKLLDLYARGSRWDRARALVERVRASFATAEGPRKPDVRKQVRLLSRFYLLTGREDLAQGLEMTFPEAFPPRPGPRK